MDLGPPGHNERISRPCDLCPVKGENAQAEAVVDTKDLIDHDVVGSDPAYPVEYRQGSEQVPCPNCQVACEKSFGEERLTGQEEKEEGSKTEVYKVPVAAESATFAVLLCVEGIQESTGDQILRPEHASRPNQEPPRKTSETKTSHLSCQDQSSAETVAQASTVVEFCDNNCEKSVREGNGDVCHHVNEGVLLDVPGTGIEGELVRAETEKAGGTVGLYGHCEGEEFAYWVGEKEEYGGDDCWGRLSEVEENVCGTVGRESVMGTVRGGSIHGRHTMS